MFNKTNRYSHECDMVTAYIWGILIKFNERPGVLYIGSIACKNIRIIVKNKYLFILRLLELHCDIAELFILRAKLSLAASIFVFFLV